MQWLTAILAFATTMFVFSMIVSVLVETIHRILRSRSSGLRRQLEHFYDQVLEPQIKAARVELNRDDFLKSMTLVRAPTSNAWICWFFARLTSLPTESFMERLGSTSFADVLKGDNAKRKLLLKDIAQKYETFGAESSRHFESWARLWSVGVAMFVAWTFYVQPYDLVQTYMKNPEVSGRLAALADGSTERYENLLKEAKQLRDKQGQNENEELDKLFTQLADDMSAAQKEVDVLSQAGAPVGWPEDKGKVGEFVLYEDEKAKEARKKRKEKGQQKERQPDVESGLTIAIYYPEMPQDVFWLLVGGLLIGLGAPFWAKMIGQLTQAQNISTNVAAILKPQSQPQSVAARSGTTANETPMTTVAFMASADAKALTDNSAPPGKS